MPYMEFTGKPNVLDHNEMGYRGKSIKDAPDSTLNILFFGGSTGYYGSPPLPVLLEKVLNKEYNLNSFIANCSVVSSNHNQHIHALLEQMVDYPIDLVIFYGGFNEVIQPLSYDPRPGYPFNFYYKNNCPRWRLLLIKYSSIIGEVEKRYGIVSGINSFRNKHYSDKSNWYKQINQNYFNVLAKTDKFVTNVLKNERREPARFIAFYQPFIVPEFYKNYNNQIRNTIEDIPYVFDISDCLDSISSNETVYYDNIHVTQKANEIIANSIAKECLRILSYNRNN